VINGLNDVVIQQVSLGERHTLLLSNEGRVYACGDGAFGQLGIGGYEGATVPKEIEALSPGKKMVDGHLQSTPPVVNPQPTNALSNSQAMISEPPMHCQILPIH
jgi:hypothetical protein